MARPVEETSSVARLRVLLNAPSTVDWMNLAKENVGQNYSRTPLVFSGAALSGGVSFTWRREEHLEYSSVMKLP